MRDAKIDPNPEKPLILGLPSVSRNTPFVNVVPPRNSAPTLYIYSY